MKNKLFFYISIIVLGLSILACGTFTVSPTATNPPAPTNPPPPTVPPEPTAVPATDTPVPTVTLLPSTGSGSEVRQWASEAEASSEYNNPSWAAIQATGAPDTPECGDHTTAWASESSGGVDWLLLTYATPVIPTQINIHQSNTPDYVVLVEVLDMNGNFLPVYSATGGAVAQCPYVLSIPVTGVNVYVYGVRITIDQTNALYWTELDAVELVGMVDSSIPVPVMPPTSTLPPFVAGECEGDALPIEMNTTVEQSVQAGTYPDICEFYCLWVPEGGSRLDISITNFDVDLDLYVDTNISVLAFEDHGQWESNAYGDGDESVSIFGPGGRYYIQVCSYEGLASTFLLTNLFIP